MAVQKQALLPLAPIAATAGRLAFSRALPWLGGLVKNWVLPSAAMEFVSNIGGKIFGGQQGAAAGQQAARSARAPRPSYYPNGLHPGFSGYPGFSKKGGRAEAFASGIDKFCKEAGLDADDREAMFRLMKLAGREYREYEGYLPGLDEEPKPTGGAAPSASSAGGSAFGDMFSEYWGDQLGLNTEEGRKGLGNALHTVGKVPIPGVGWAANTAGDIIGAPSSPSHSFWGSRTGDGKQFVNADEYRARLARKDSKGRPVIAPAKTRANQEALEDTLGKGVAGIDTSRRPEEMGNTAQSEKVKHDHLIRTLSDSSAVNPVSITTSLFGRKGKNRDAAINALQAAIDNPKADPVKKRIMEDHMQRLLKLRSDHQATQAQGQAAQQPTQTISQQPGAQPDAAPAAQRTVNPSWRAGRDVRAQQNAKYQQALKERQAEQAARTAKYQAGRPGAAGAPGAAGQAAAPKPQAQQAATQASRGQIFTTPEIASELQSRGWGNPGGAQYNGMTEVMAPQRPSRATASQPPAAAPDVSQQSGSPSQPAVAQQQAPPTAAAPGYQGVHIEAPAWFGRVFGGGSKGVQQPAEVAQASDPTKTQSEGETLGPSRPEPSQVGQETAAAPGYQGPVPGAQYGGYTMPSAERQRELMAPPAATPQNATGHGTKEQFEAGMKKQFAPLSQGADAAVRQINVAPRVSRPEPRYKDMELPGAAGRALTGFADWFTRSGPDWKDYSQMGVPQAEFAERYNRMKQPTQVAQTPNPVKQQPAAVAQSSKAPAPAAPSKGTQFQVAPSMINPVRRQPAGAAPVPAKRTQFQIAPSMINPVRRQPKATGG